ncbi:MAG: hypothetical protein AAFY71_04550 [Bacteroidota bacterium]
MMKKLFTSVFLVLFASTMFASQAADPQPTQKEYLTFVISYTEGGQHIMITYPSGDHEEYFVVNSRLPRFVKKLVKLRRIPIVEADLVSIFDNSYVMKRLNEFQMEGWEVASHNFTTAMAGTESIFGDPFFSDVEVERTSYYLLER